MNECFNKIRSFDISLATYNNIKKHLGEVAEASSRYYIHKLLPLKKFYKTNPSNEFKR